MLFLSRSPHPSLRLQGCPGHKSVAIWLLCIPLLPSGFHLLQVPLAPVLFLVSTSLPFALAQFAQFKPFPRVSFLPISGFCRLQQKSTELLETHRRVSAGIPALFLGCLFVGRAQPCLCLLASEPEVLQVGLELFSSYLLSNQDSCSLFRLLFLSLSAQYLHADKKLMRIS